MGAGVPGTYDAPRLLHGAVGGSVADRRLGVAAGRLSARPVGILRSRAGYERLTIA